ncbi:DUF11 domain-containing protein [Patescibacteria group bacterium]|nr:DUF11 domain-containing protein [Patescibacteria group bacterium]
MKKRSFASCLYQSGLLVAVLTLFSFLVVPPVFAQYTPPQPTPSKRFYVDKKIFNPQTMQYVDNLNRDQYLFTPSQTVFFQLVVTNTGNDDLNNIDVTDQLPPQLSYVTGGSVNTDTKGGSANTDGKIHFSIDKLSPGSQSQPLLVEAKVNVDQGAIGIICPVNLAQAKTESLLDQDTSTFCIQQNIIKPIPPVKELPKTGAPLAAWSAVGLLPVGFRLRKFALNNSNDIDEQNHANYIWQVREFIKRGGELNE